ncbi:MAG: response regulator [Rhodocyclaceae bacterium]|nr:response regulator [Rhodocyclaceae bacterium]
MRPGQLAARILALALAAMLLASVTAVGSSGYLFLDQLKQTELARADAIAAGLRVQLERLLALGIDLEHLVGFEAQCADAVSNNEGLSHAMVLSPDGRILFQNPPQPDGRSLAGTSLWRAVVEGARNGHDGDTGLYFAASEVVRSGMDPAWIIVGFPIERITGQRDRLIAIAVGGSAIAIGVGLLLLGVGVSRFVTTPMSRLLASIELLRQGDNKPGQRLPREGLKEFDRISTSFNRLLDRVEMHESELRSAKEMAQAASRAKSAFLANMSHELRTPLNAVIGLSELVRQRSTDPGILEHLEMVGSAGMQLLGIVNDVLDISRIEAQRLTLRPRPTAVARLLREQVALVEGQARDKGLRVDVTVDASVEAAWFEIDGLRVGQVLLNLLGNAVKFTHQGWIAARLAPVEPAKGPQLLRFEVQDSGIGVDRNQVNRLFMPFEQADNSSTRRYGGTGLGLSICRQLVELMGGRIGVDSRLGDGSLFWFELPCPAATPAPAAEPAVARPLVDGERARILVVEDDALNRAYTLGLLAELGLGADVAEDASAAISRIDQQAYDLILLDIRLPVMDGYEVARRVRGMPNGAEVPIVALTANVFDEDREACLAVGMNDFLPKPVDSAMFERTVRFWLARVPSGGA